MTNNSKIKQRIAIINQIEKKRNSMVITYITANRPPFNTQIASDAVRIMRKHFDVLGKQKTISLFLYSNGGHMVAPLQICRVIKEYADNFEVIVPFHALSAATLICLGADKILMGKLAELSPVDPSTGHPFNPIDPSDPKQQRRFEISVEDLTSYFLLAKEKANVRDEQMVQIFNELANKIHPLALGNIYRGYRAIRELSRKLLLLHMDRSKDANKIEEIIKKLTTELCIHGYPIVRDEAEKELSLDIERPTDETENLIWKLYEKYEDELELTKPFNPMGILKDKATQNISYFGAYIESIAFTDAFTFEVTIKRIKNTPKADVSIKPAGWKEISKKGE